MGINEISTISNRAKLMKNSLEEIKESLKDPTLDWRDLENIQRELFFHKQGVEQLYRSKEALSRKK